MTPRPSRRNAARRLFNHALSLLNKGRVRPQLGRVAPQISTPKSNCAKSVSNDPDAMRRLVIGDKFLNVQKFALSDIIASPGVVAEKVTEYLRALVFHDLSRVDFLYRTALGVRILKDDVDKEKLFTAVKYRHDCVHRNGIDRNGTRLAVFTKAYVQETADLIRALVDHVEREIHGDSPF